MDFIRTQFKVAARLMVNWKLRIKERLYHIVQLIAYRFLAKDKTEMQSFQNVSQPSPLSQSTNYINTLANLDQALQEAEDAFQLSHFNYPMMKVVRS